MPSLLLFLFPIVCWVCPSFFSPIFFYYPLLISSFFNMFGSFCLTNIFILGCCFVIFLFSYPPNTLLSFSPLLRLFFICSSRTCLNWVIKFYVGLAMGYFTPNTLGLHPILLIYSPISV